MASKTETLNLKVKSDVGEVGKDAKNAAGEFRIMGVSLNSVKAGFISAGKQGKLMFASIKAGLISTGIGAFLVAIGSLVSYFTNTKRGADQLEKALSGMGAVVDVLKDRFSKFGEILTFVFSGEFQKAGEALKETFSGIADEIEREVVAMMELKKRTQELRDADLEFMVQKAATRQEIERARLIAEDETKSAKERLDNLKKALELEKETTQQELALAAERVAIQELEMKQSENLIEDEEKLAQLKVAFIEKETASIKMRRRVVTEVNALEREIHAEQMARQKEKQEAFEEEQKAYMERFKDIVKMPETVNKVNEELIQADNEYFKNLEIENKKKKQLEEDLQEFKKEATMQGLSLLEQAAGQGTVIGKAAAIAQATISGVQGVQNAFTAANANIALTAATAGAYPITMATLAGGFAAMNIAKIAAGSPPGGGGGGGGGGAPEMVSQIPAPQMMSGAFELGGGLAPEPMKAFVVTDEVTNSQDQLANIRRQATI